MPVAVRFPSAGDGITLLRDRNSGHIEDSPFPELWLVLVVVYGFFGALIWMFVGGTRRIRESDRAQAFRKARTNS